MAMAMFRKMNTRLLLMKRTTLGSLSYTELDALKSPKPVAMQSLMLFYPLLS